MFCGQGVARTTLRTWFGGVRLFVTGIRASLFGLCTIALCGSAAWAENQVAIENSLPGTADWSLTSPATNRQIEGYASATSVNAGASISLYVNTTAPSFRLEIFRMGWYQGLGARRVFGPIDVAGQSQVVPSPGAHTGLWTAIG